MKLTKSQLKQIVKEELAIVTEGKPGRGPWVPPEVSNAITSLAEAIVKDPHSDPSRLGHADTQDIRKHILKAVKKEYYVGAYSQEEIDQILSDYRASPDYDPNRPEMSDKELDASLVSLGFPSGLPSYRAGIDTNPK